MLTRCPYTLKALSELDQTSREHIILDALGGPNRYSVIASREVNNQLGQNIDAAFLAEPLVQMFRSKVGVKSRSSVASWELAGQTVDGGRPVEVSIPHRGSVELYHRKPVERDALGKSFQIIAAPEQAQRILKEMTENLTRKGMQISSVNTTQSPTQEIHAQLTLNLTVMKAGLMKIAYLACCDLLGDSFLDDPLNREWQKAIRAQNESEADNVKIHGQSFNGATAAANLVIPPLAEHEHGIVIANLNQSGPIVAVRLFGCELLTVVALASETSNYALAVGHGQQLICDSITGALLRAPYPEILTARYRI
jgi:hypothetical protein